MEWVGPVPLWAPNRSGGSVGAVAMIIIYPGALSDLSPASSVVSPCVVGSATVSVQAADRCHDTNQLLLLTLDPLALARDIFRFSQWTIPPSPPFLPRPALRLRHAFLKTGGPRTRSPHVSVPMPI